MSYTYNLNSQSSRTEQPSSYTAEETVVQETSARSIPMHVETTAPLTSKFDDFFLEPVSLPRSGFAGPLISYPQPRATSVLPPPQPRVRFQPMTVHWDYYTPNAINPEQQLQRMDREFHRLAGEMNHLLAQSGNAPVAASSLGGDAYYPATSDSRHHTAVERVLNQTDPYHVTGLPSYDAPRGFVRVSPASSGTELLPRGEANLWGSDAHAESWRRKENFHMDNPVVKSRDGHSQFRLEFDLRQFNPEEIQVLADDVTRLLTVQAKHEESKDGRKARREYFRQCVIPEDVEPRCIISRLTKSGILTVYAPLKEDRAELAGNVEVPIRIKHTEH